MASNIQGEVNDKIVDMLYRAIGWWEEVLGGDQHNHHGRSNLYFYLELEYIGD